MDKRTFRKRVIKARDEEANTSIGERIGEIVNFLAVANVGREHPHLRSVKEAREQIKALLTDTLKSVKLPEKKSPETGFTDGMRLFNTGYNAAISEAQEAINQVIKEIEGDG